MSLYFSYSGKKKKKCFKNIPRSLSFMFERESLLIIDCTKENSMFLVERKVTSYFAKMLYDWFLKKWFH